MVLSSDCISVATTVQTVMMKRLAVAGAGVAVPACGPVRDAVPTATALRLHLHEVLFDALQYAGGDGDLLVGQAGQHGGADLARGALDLVDDGPPLLGQTDDLGPPIGVFPAALDEAGGLEGIQQAHDRGAVENQRGAE